MSLYIGAIDKATGRTYPQLIASTVNADFIRYIADKYFMPSIGDVKYLAVPSSSVINVNDENFDGWVYADGTTYEVPSDKFAEAKQMFGTSPAATRMTVPDLCYFLRPQPNKFASTWPPSSGEAAVNHVDSSCGCSSHQHNIDTVINYSNGSSFVITNAFKMRLTDTEKFVVAKPNSNVIRITSTDWPRLMDPNDDYYNYYPAGHGPSNSKGSGDTQVNVDLNFNAKLDFSLFPTGETGVDNPDTYPEYVPIFVMVYIGKK